MSKVRRRIEGCFDEAVGRNIESVNMASEVRRSVMSMDPCIVNYSLEAQ